MAKERFLVTGATGFVGSKTAEKLNAKVFDGDVKEITDWHNNLQGGEIIFLIAGVRTETDADFAVNSYSIESLYNAALKTNKLPKKIILASSQAVYMGNQIPFKETDEPHPTTIYGCSKLLGEKIAQELNIPLVILRYSTVLGSGVREQSKMSGPIFAWSKAAKAGEPIKVFQDGNQTRDYVHVDDVVNANILAINLPNGIYNVSGGQAIKLIDLANWIKQASGSSSEILIMGGEPSVSDPKDMFSDITKIESHRWKPKRTAREAAQEFVTS